MPSPARLAACFAIGAVAGTLLDGLHLLGDVLSYEHEAFGDWAWFVPLEFGLAGVAAGVAIPLLEGAVGPDPPPRFTTLGRAREVVLCSPRCMAPPRCSTAMGRRGCWSG